MAMEGGYLLQGQRRSPTGHHDQNNIQKLDISLSAENFLFLRRNQQQQKIKNVKNKKKNGNSLNICLSEGRCLVTNQPHHICFYKNECWLKVAHAIQCIVGTQVTCVGCE